MKMKKPSYYAMALALLSSAFNAHAFTQGSIGATSTGDVRINLPVGVKARISSLEDFDFPTWDGISDQEMNDDICAAVNTGSGNYMLSVEGDGLGGAFTLHESGGATLPYHVYYNDEPGTSGRVEVPAGGTLTGQQGASVHPSCQRVIWSYTYILGNQYRTFGFAVPNTEELTGNISVKINAADFGNVPAGAYSGILTLTLIPE